MGAESAFVYIVSRALISFQKLRVRYMFDNLHFFVRPTEFPLTL